MKVLVTGAHGQLGSDVVARLESSGIETVAAGKNDFDITDRDSVFSFFEKEKPSAVIHCAAYTAVDRAETEKELCRKVNVEGSANVAEASQSVGAKMIYVSTDYVFGSNGTKPLETDDEKNPLNVYGQSKLDGENAVLAACGRVFVVRVSWVFGRNGANFVKSMIRLGEERSELKVVCDQTGSPTFTEDLAVLFCDMIQTEKYGVYHATNEGYCSWADFASEIMKLSGTACRVIPVPSSEYRTDAVRQLNSRLSKASLDENGFSRLPPWRDALGRYFSEE